jgi:DNA-cytosine methyltransferase
MNGINVLSLFDGMSCGQIALQKLGIKVNQYFAAEIDKHAIQVTQKNFPKTIQLGDVTKIKGSNLPKIDLLIGGSPCQGFSFAGKQLAFDDPRSKLFFEFVRLKNECNPTYFMLENVKMKKEFEIIISSYIGVAPIEINSALLSAQNRVRLYWTNIANEPYGLFGDMQCVIPQPKDKGILLKDILQSNVPDKYYLSDKMLNYFASRAANFNQGKVNIREEEGKASCLTSSMASCDISDNFIKIDTTLKKSVNQNKANCFTARGNSGGLHSDMTLICVDANGRLDKNKTNTLTSSYGKGIENYRTRPFILQIPEATKKGYIEVNPGECFDFENPKSETRRGRKMDNKSNFLMAKETDFMQYTKNGKIRRLTPTECERLQTVPDGYTDSVSDTQRYRMLGNGWTVDVIAHIFSFINLKQTQL